MFWSKKKEKYQAQQLMDATFNEAIEQATGPILLDFYASWCGPCKILGPFIDELAEDYQDRALIAKVNVDQNPQLVQHFKVKSMPTLILISEGKVAERFSGLVPKPNLEELLDAYIADPTVIE